MDISGFATRSRCGFLAAAASVVLGAFFGLPAAAQTPEQFYRARPLELIVGYGPGGGFDTYARLLAPHLSRAIGTDVVVVNRPGGNNLNALNQMVRSARDGRAIMLLNGEAAILSQLVQLENVRFDLRELTYLGRVAAEKIVVLARANTTHQTPALMQAAREPLKWAAGGRTDGLGDQATMTCQTLTLSCRLVTGYNGSRAAFLGVVNGEADFVVGYEATAVSFLRGGDMRGVLVLDRRRSELLPDVPAALEGARTTAEGEWWLDFAVQMRELGRVLVAAPGIPQDRAQFLASAIRRVVTDPEVIAEGRRLTLTFNHADEGQLRRIVEQVLSVPTQDRITHVRETILTRY